MPPAEPAGLGVLVVCTANVCRSPLVAGLLRHRLDTTFGARARRVTVAGAGTHAVPGDVVDEPVLDVLAQVTGRPAQRTRARRLDADLVRGADLVLAMTRQHRSDVLALVPAAQRSVFTLLELARIARALTAPGLPPGTGHRGDPAAAWRALLAAAPALRGPTAPRDPAADDLADVHGLPAEHYERTARQVGAALDAVFAALPPGR
ncbi:low molecular weight phosphatase family protein [Kineococcus sp. NUM-3379]